MFIDIRTLQIIIHLRFKVSDAGFTKVAKNLHVAYVWINKWPLDKSIIVKQNTNMLQPEEKCTCTWRKISTRRKLCRQRQALLRLCGVLRYCLVPVFGF
jgi:hypothetical protein